VPAESTKSSGTTFHERTSPSDDLQNSNRHELRGGIAAGGPESPADAWVGWVHRQRIPGIASDTLARQWRAGCRGQGVLHR
jgi:hypothetical protein